MSAELQMTIQQGSAVQDRGAGTATAETDPHNSLPEPTETRANGRNPVEIAPSGNLHPKLVRVLSQVPYSPLFGILWPLIVKQASFEVRDRLRDVSHYFEALCRPYRCSDEAKSIYVLCRGNPEDRKGLPFVLDLSFDTEWRCWGADKCGFNSVQAFRAFCALGDVDPDQGRSWGPYAALYGRTSSSPGMINWIWMSRKKDVVFETLGNPLKNEFCHYLGLTGIADKAITMFDFMFDNIGESDEDSDEPNMTTSWAVMGYR